MRLSIKAMAAASGLLWGSALLVVGLINGVRPSYGRRFLQLMSSVYPGYRVRRTPGSIAVGTAYGLFDGAVGGAVFALLYNQLSGVLEARTPRTAKSEQKFQVSRAENEPVA